MSVTTTDTVHVRIPTILRTYTKGQADVTVEVAAGSTLSDVITVLDANHPGIGARVLDDAGALRRFVNVYLDDDDVRFAEGLATPVTAGSRISVIPAVAGG